ncbi:MAG: IS5/IS1182 family transposase, partial [Proteobacteria bacterium]|nr:IS5/IS1182 family transposase [Pseudomonadota bacterium]
LQGVRAEFSLACIAYNLKRIWTIKSQTEAIGVNSTKNGRIDHSSLKNMCSSIKEVWSHILSSFSKGLSIYQL